MSGQGSAVGGGGGGGGVAASCSVGICRGDALAQC